MKQHQTKATPEMIADIRANCQRGKFGDVAGYSTKHGLSRSTVLRILNDTHSTGPVGRRRKLTPEQVREIRATYRPYSSEYCAPALARKYGVHHVTISAIVSYKTRTEGIPPHEVAALRRGHARLMCEKHMREVSP
jgi:hypothetical protein